MVRSILYYILLVVFTLLCLIPFAVLFLLTVLFDRERVVLHWASRMWSYGIFRLCPCWRIRIEGAEKIDRSRPWVIVTNHQSMLDGHHYGDKLIRRAAEAVKEAFSPIGSCYLIGGD